MKLSPCYDEVYDCFFLFLIILLAYINSTKEFHYISITHIMYFDWIHPVVFFLLSPHPHFETNFKTSVGTPGQVTVFILKFFSIWWDENSTVKKQNKQTNKTIYNWVF
jgi:hypothetical protein